MNNYNEDVRYIEAIKLYEPWTEKMTIMERDEIDELLSLFSYYTKLIVNCGLVELHNSTMKDLSGDYDKTIFSVIQSQDPRINSSFETIIEYRDLNNVSKFSVYHDLNKLSESEIAKIDNFIFIDDFLGTGKTTTDFLKSNLALLKTKRIILLYIHAMVSGVEAVTKYAMDIDLNLTIKQIEISDKVYKELPEEQRKVKSNLIDGLSKKRDLTGHYLGFKESGSLVAFFNGTPNNTLPIFWQKTELNQAIFPRKIDQRPAWSDMRKAKKTRKIDTYYAVKRSNQNG